MAKIGCFYVDFASGVLEASHLCNSFKSLRMLRLCAFSVHLRSKLHRLDFHSLFFLHSPCRSKQGGTVWVPHVGEDDHVRDRGSNAGCQAEVQLRSLITWWPASSVNARRARLLGGEVSGLNPQRIRKSHNKRVCNQLSQE